MSEPVLERRGGGGPAPEPIDADSAIRLYHRSIGEPRALGAAASKARDEAKGRVVSFSKKAFVSLTRLCRDVCSYCTYRSEPEGEPFMPPDEVGALLGRARRLGCVEALIVAGERPEERYDEAAGWLEQNGMSSTAEYIARCSEIAISHGMFPHTNAGNLSEGEFRALSETNASVGLMLESASERLCAPAMPHHGAPSKSPRRRLAALEDAGRAGIPTTTGILVGIGESPEEAIESLAAIDAVNRRYGHIQEVIVQNFRPKPDTAMASRAPAGAAHFAAVIALARLLMPGMNIQAPPNLSPGTYGGLLGYGINDWGGISPITQDYVNPEFAWPQIPSLEAQTRASGYELRCRFPAYPEYLDMMPQKLQAMAQERADADGYVAGHVWRSPR